MAGAQWQMPAHIHKADGQPRRVGVEFELQGINVEALAQLTADTLGGRVRRISDVEYAVAVPDADDYRVEVDFSLLKRMAKQHQELDVDERSVLDKATLDVLSAASSVLVPCEVVTPPLDMELMPSPMERLTHAIRDAGGKGTRHSALYAFGLHLNVEPPDLDADTICAYLKAFTCLFDWIVWAGDVDWARRATPYIKRYPPDYERHVTNPDYWPEWDELVTDYLQWNASRNRALDMLPMMLDQRPALVRAAVDDERVKGRPAFHYRLANCSIDEPEWSIADPWGRWLQIEQLANDRDALNACCEAFRVDHERLLHRVDDGWRKQVTQWLTE